MSALGQKQIFRSAITMSALAPKADIQDAQVECPVPLDADKNSFDGVVGGLLDHLFNLGCRRGS